MNSRTYKHRLLRGGYTLLLFFTPANAASPEATVRGNVTNTSTGAGLRKAYLTLTQVGGGPSYHAVTTDQGTFAIDSIAPGNYHLDAECSGFLDARHSPELRLIANQNLTGIEVKLIPQAVLSGRVVDEDGDPWPYASIGIYHSVWQKGRKRVDGAESTGISEVNDRGEFRIAGLAPGRYYVRAEPDEGWEKQHHPDVTDQPAIRQQPTWYPSSSDIDSAAPITLSAGQQLNGLDIRLRRGVGSRLRILGKVSGLQNIPGPQGDPRMVGRRIFARRASSVTVDEIYSGTITPDGSFKIAGVSSGTYDIWMTQGYAWSGRLGQATVQVDDRDVENVSIELHPPQTLHVNVSIEGDPAKPPRIPVNLEAVDSLGIEPYSIPRDDGSIDFSDLGLGRYRVYVQEPFRRRAYLKSLRYGNAESHDGTFTLASYGVPLELVFSTQGAQLTGTISGQAKTPRVVLIPTTSDAARTATFDQNGVFTIEAIPPGSYKLYAFENVPEDIWVAPEFLKEIESAGVPFEATEGAASAIQLPLLSKSDTDLVLAKLGIE